ncbi:MAG: hypothetical protein AB8G77_01740 [Rhodothermales bacterium]
MKIYVVGHFAVRVIGGGTRGGIGKLCNFLPLHYFFGRTSRQDEYREGK